MKKIHSHSQLVVTNCASPHLFSRSKPTLRAHLSLMGFYILRSMSATLFAFLVVMCATPADCSEQSAGSCQPEPSMCDSSIGGDCCMSRKLSDEFRWCRDGWIPIYTGVLPLLRRCHSCVDPGKGSCLRRAALSTELLPRPCTVPHRNIVLGRQQRLHLLLPDMFGNSCG